jgi:hypothetical protein
MPATYQDQPPAPPAPPTPPPQAQGTDIRVAPVQPAIVQDDGRVIPLTGPITTREQVQILRAQRSELSDQLISATGRRASLVREHAEADPAIRPGLEQRIQVLDARILQLEQDIASTGERLSSAEGGLTSATSTPFSDGMSPSQYTAISIVLIIFVLAPLAFAWASRLTRRTVAPKAPRNYYTDSSERMERLEQAVDTIAIEIERISEGQRFLTRVLGEGAAAPILKAGDSPAQRVPVGSAKGPGSAAG